MMKYLSVPVLFFSFVFLTASTNADAQKSDKTSITAGLPAGVEIKENILRVKTKEGFSLVISADKKTATVYKDKDVSGIFVCGCNESQPGSCNLSTHPDRIICSGDCRCFISSVVKGVRYRVDMVAGKLVKL